MEYSVKGDKTGNALITLFVFTMMFSVCGGGVLIPDSAAAADVPDVAYVFSIAMSSTKESQHYPFTDRLVYNYTPNPSLLFLEGKTFSADEVKSFVKSVLIESDLQKLSVKKWLSVSNRIWINSEAKTVLHEAQEANISVIYFLNLQSIALVQAINQGKTLFGYNRNKPDETVSYDFFYSVRGEVALIDVKNESILYKKTLNALDFKPPHQEDREELQLLLHRTAVKLGNMLYDVAKENRDKIETGKVGEASESVQ